MPTPRPSAAIKLYGTEQAVPSPQTLTAGPLSAVLDNGSLRYIKVHGWEAIRAIAFVARDAQWGTYNPEIHDLKISSADGGFSVSYRAVCKDSRQELAYRVNIAAEHSGGLRFDAELEPVTDWTTMRTGFVVLHGVHGIAGEPVTVVHTDGSVDQSEFPDLIKPSQPFFDIRSLSHQVAPGLTVECIMQGDAYEAEDQRNWTDASYKTYIRPLAKRPAPYTLSAGERSAQSVTLALKGEPSSIESKDAQPQITLGAAAAGVLPALGLAVAPQWLDSALAHAQLIRPLEPSFLVCHYDPGKGHDAGTMAGFRKLGATLGAGLWLEAVVPCQDATGRFTADAGVMHSDLDALAAAAAGVEFAAVTASPKAYLKSYQPDAQWPSVPALDIFYKALRERFPKARIGGGMLSYFTELNRKRPPAQAIDFITHTTSPIVHTADDISVMESLESLPSVMRSAQNLAPGKPYCIGPSGIGMRMNPYGSEPAPNPDNERVPMAGVDPRQRGLFNAAWTLGYIAYAAQHQVEALTLSAPVGEHGIVYTKTDWPQPWFDDIASTPLVYPVYHVLRALAPAAGRPVRPLQSSVPDIVQGLAVETADGLRLWLANLSAEPITLGATGIGASARVWFLDEGGFEAFCTHPEYLSTPPGNRQSLDKLVLGPYAAACIQPVTP